MPQTVRLGSGVLAALALVALTPPTAAAQNPPAQTRPPACTAAEHRQFDFWLGEWDVSNQAGQAVGHNRITSILDGCVLREEWTAAGGGEGTSYNIYNRASGRWHQTWVDKSGTLLLIDGGLDSAGAMVMGNTARRPDGTTIMNRITWTRLGADEVRQHWETSADGGANWQTAFDGLYRRKR